MAAPQPRRNQSRTADRWDQPASGETGDPAGRRRGHGENRGTMTSEAKTRGSAD